MSETEKDAIRVWHAIMQEALQDEPLAYGWLSEVQNIAFELDHIVDKDSDASPTRLMEVFQPVFLHWPINAWFLRNAPALAPVMASCWNGWKHSDLWPESRVWAYSVACDLACAVLFLVGGTDLLNKYGGKIRAATIEIMRANDSKKE